MSSCDYTHTRIRRPCEVNNVNKKLRLYFFRKRKWKGIKMETFVYMEVLFYTQLISTCSSNDIRKSIWKRKSWKLY